MSEAPTRVLIEGGRRQGRTLQNEHFFRTAIAEGKNVVTQRNGIYFVVSLDGESIVYTALTSRPEGIDPLA